MAQNEFVIVLFFTFILGAGIGFYVARLFF